MKTSPTRVARESTPEPLTLPMPKQTPNCPPESRFHACCVLTDALLHTMAAATGHRISQSDRSSLTSGVDKAPSLVNPGPTVNQLPFWRQKPRHPQSESGQSGRGLTYIHTRCSHILNHVKRLQV